MKTSAQRPARHAWPRRGVALAHQSDGQTDKLSFHLRDTNGASRANNAVSHFVSQVDPDRRELAGRKND